MTQIEKIKGEIERLVKEINLFTPNEGGKNDTYECGRLAMASDILGIIDSLEEEPVSNDLEEVDLEKAFFDWYHEEKNKDYNASILYERYGTISKKLAEYFFEFGLKAKGE